jgi:ribosome biogenesis GTPase / thiamine phosphate phosphatase
LPDMGLVIRNDGPRFWVALNGIEVPCVLRGRLKREQQRVTSLVVVGDQVAVTLGPDGSGVVEAVAPRRTELSRPGFHGYVHVMAANVDQLVIVQAAQQPRFKLHLAERFQVIARRGRMDAVVVVNKCDLEHEATIRSWVAPLAQAGVGVLLTSTADGRGIAELRDLLRGRVSVLAGQSGVGKSSLVNAIYGEALARTSWVSESSTKGRHTTTSSRLYALPDGGYLVDTPGIRALEMFDDDAEEDAASALFPEITRAAEGCKFRNCSHSHEPHCAVKAAVARGEIRKDRYEHYLRLYKGAI